MTEKVVSRIDAFVKETEIFFPGIRYTSRCVRNCREEQIVELAKLCSDTGDGEAMEKTNSATCVLLFAASQLRTSGI